VEGYKDLSELVRERIAMNRYPVGSLLPSERDLAEEFQLNRRTVRRSLQLLEEQRILAPESTRGRRVVQLPNAPVVNLALCFDDSLDQRDQFVRATMSSAEIARGFHSRVQTDGRSAVTWLDVDNTRLVMNGEPPRIQDLVGIAIWPTVPCSDAVLERLRLLASRCRIVLLDRRLPGLQCDFVGFDDHGIGVLAAERFIQLGYTSYAFIGWAVAETVLMRMHGFEAQLRSHGLDLDDDWVLLTRHDGAPTKQFRRFLAEGRPRAVFCANDLIAASLLLYLRNHGVRVPEDVAIIGVGDSMGGLTEAIGLTSISLPHSQVGWEAADILLQSLRGGRANDLLPIERRKAAQLVIRRSCGAAI